MKRAASAAGARSGRLWGSATGTRSTCSSTAARRAICATQPLKPSKSRRPPHELAPRSRGKCRRLWAMHFVATFMQGYRSRPADGFSTISCALKGGRLLVSAAGRGRDRLNPLTLSRAHCARRNALECFVITPSYCWSSPMSLLTRVMWQAGPANMLSHCALRTCKSSK